MAARSTPSSPSHDFVAYLQRWDSFSGEFHRTFVKTVTLWDVDSNDEKLRRVFGRSSSAELVWENPMYGKVLLKKTDIPVLYLLREDHVEYDRAKVITSVRNMAHDRAVGEKNG